MTENAGQIGQLMRTLGGQIRDALGLGRHIPMEAYTPRSLVVDKVSRNAVAELVNQAKNHPQRGDLNSANPAYVALYDLTEDSGILGLALGIRQETREITFLDLNMPPEEVTKQGGAYVDRRLNRNLWRQLKKLVLHKVDSTMLGPTRPIRSPEEAYIPDEVEL